MSRSDVTTLTLALSTAAPAGASQVAHPGAADPPLFRFGEPEGADTAPLTIISGGLILDNGEAERTFIYRCQDRFLSYSSLWGLRTIFFVAGDTHVAVYRDRMLEHCERFERIRRRTGLFGRSSMLEPLYVGCDIDRLRIFAGAGFARSLADAAPQAQAGIAINQISPTYAELLKQLESLVRQQGLWVDWSTDECARMGALALHCADKANYVALVEGGRGLPAHTPTMVLGAPELLAIADYDTLAALVRSSAGGEAQRARGVFVKATRNSSGNSAALLRADNFADEVRKLRDILSLEAATAGPNLHRKIRELRDEVGEAPCLRPVTFSDGQLRSYRLAQARYHQDVDFLLQPEVFREEGDQAFASVGLSYRLRSDACIVPLGASAQVYRDGDHKHFLGAFLSDTVEDEIPPTFHQQMLELCQAYCALGYHGPINFDARRNTRGTYELIYDCNPRLTGIFPALAVRHALAASNIAARSVLTLGYRGEFILPDLDLALARLDDAGLLCKPERQRGAVLLPNLCRENGFDIHLVNVGLAEANRLLSSTTALAAISAAALHPRCLFY